MTEVNLLNNVETVSGIGPKTAAALKKRGINTIRDLLYYFPRAYEDYAATTKITDVKPGKIIVKAKIKNLRTRYTRRRNFNITEGEIYDQTTSIRVVWYNQPYRAKAFDPEKEYFFTGQYELKAHRYQLISPTTTPASEIRTTATGGFQPIYPASGFYNSAWFKRFFLKLRPTFTQIPDLLPEIKPCPEFLQPKARANALLNMHFPDRPSDVIAAKKYLAYEELFELILASKLNQRENHQLCALKLNFLAEKTQNFIKSLPFQLTPDQKLTSWQILQDLEKTTPMNRLLQGDVGSGKTVVAAIAAHQTVSNGYQVALLAPTAILATQHAEGLRSLLEPFGVKIALLTGATKQKTTLKTSIKNGEIDLIIGTHALLTDDTEFKNLALVIIDEQHRFGVDQRQKLLSKTNYYAPHLLSMTATPIPRSLQLTIFGDLDISTIKHLPKGRQPISTKILQEHQLKQQLYPVIRQKLQQNQQIYWICRNIDDDPRTETISVKKQSEKLQKIFPTVKITFLHGRMKPMEKDQIMTDFAQQKIDILVSTTVVEVGIDLPNATQIVIMDAERYGLAQLHQLRGRVGRGQLASSCFLITTGENPPSERLRELEKSQNGFHLAEIDLKIRGPGEIYGRFQHGELNLKIANFADTELISSVQKQVDKFLKNPDHLLKYPELACSIHKYQRLTTLN